MKTEALFFLLFLFLSPFKIWSNDKNMNDEFKKLSIDNAELKIKVDVLNEANNKILNVTYAVLAIFTTLSAINYFKSQDEIKKLKKEFSDKFEREIQKITQKSSQEIKTLFLENSEKQRIKMLELNIFSLKISCPNLVNTVTDINTEIYRIFQIVELSIQLYSLDKNSDELEKILSHITNYYQQHQDHIKYEKDPLERIYQKIASINELKSKPSVVKFLDSFQKWLQ